MLSAILQAPLYVGCSNSPMLQRLSKFKIFYVKEGTTMPYGHDAFLAMHNLP